MIDILIDGPVATLSFARPDKANAVNRATMEALEMFFRESPKEVRAVVLTGSGKHFCGGLDLNERKPDSNRQPMEAIAGSRYWHMVTNLMRFGHLPIVSALHGAAMGGGLELAASTHVRVADETAFFSLPEGQRRVFVGGGGSVRIARLIGAPRMTEMMLTGRRLSAQEALNFGLVDYVVPAGGDLARAQELAKTIATNSEMSNYLAINAIGRIADAPEETGLFTESMSSALIRYGADAKTGVDEFLSKEKK